jgi:hypothetical protein
MIAAQFLYNLVCCGTVLSAVSDELQYLLPAYGAIA